MLNLWAVLLATEGSFREVLVSSGLISRLWERHPWSHRERLLLVKNATHEQVGLALQGLGRHTDLF